MNSKQPQEPPVWAEKATRIMREKNIERVHLLELLEVKSVASVGHYFSGRTKLSLTQLIKFADFLGTTASELLGETPNMLLRDDAHNILVDTLKFVLLTKNVANDDVKTFFRVIDEVDPKDIIKALRAISEAEGQNSRVSSGMAQVMTLIANR